MHLAADALREAGLGSDIRGMGRSLPPLAVSAAAEEHLVFLGDVQKEAPAS